MQAIQLQRLKFMVQRAYNHVALFRKRMDDAGLEPTDVRSLDDVTKLPFTVKTDLRDTYPFGLFASPMKDIVRLHASTGTTGKPIVVAYTKEDIDVWSNVMMRSFAACGLHAGDVIQNAYGYGLFTLGLGAHYGGEALAGDGDSHFRRQHAAAVDGDERFWQHGDLLHAELLFAHHRTGAGTRRETQGTAVARRRFRR